MNCKHQLTQVFKGFGESFGDTLAMESERPSLNGIDGQYFLNQLDQ